MKICYLANTESSHTVKWVNYFLSLGHEIHVVSHSKTDIPGANVHYIDYNLKNFVFKVREVHKLIRKINPDVVHAHQANTCGLYGVSLKDYKVIVSAWGSDILVVPTLSRILKKVVQYVVKNAYYITSDSFYMSDKIVELGGRKDKIYTFPMGVEEPILKYKQEINPDSINLNIISTRRLEKMYKVDVIINGFFEALKINSNFFLTVAADGTEMNNLQDQVRRLGIEDKVKFTGRYNPNLVGKLLKDNHVFISIPDSDSTSVSLLEAMYCGLFTIVSDLPANREWIDNKVNGIIIPEINEECVKHAMLWCYDNREVLKKASIQNRKLILDRALWKDNAKIVENLYEKVISSK